MKKHLLFFALVLISASAFAQKPVWAKRLPSVPANANYFVNWGEGEGRNEVEATNAAWADALYKSLHELGIVYITEQDISAVANKGIDAVVKFNMMKRRIIASTTPVSLGNGHVKIYILIQVQRSATGADDFYTLNTARFTDRSFEKEAKITNEGRYPFSARVFVPGMAQFHKGSTGKGIFFIVAEAACVGGIVATECMRSSYASKANSTHDAGKKQTYIDRRNNCANVRNGFIAGAAAFYLWNVIDGIAAKGKKRGIHLGDAQLRMSPYVAPQASGVALSLNF